MNTNTLLIWSNIFWLAISARKVLQKSTLLLVFSLKLKNSISVEHFCIYTMLDVDHFSMRLWVCSKVSRIKACSFFSDLVLIQNGASACCTARVGQNQCLVVNNIYVQPNQLLWFDKALFSSSLLFLFPALSQRSDR